MCAIALVNLLPCWRLLIIGVQFFKKRCPRVYFSIFFCLEYVYIFQNYKFDNDKFDTDSNLYTLLKSAYHPL